MNIHEHSKISEIARNLKAQIGQLEKLLEEVEVKIVEEKELKYN